MRSKSHLTRRDVLGGATALAASGFAAVPGTARAQGADAVRLSLDFRIYGGTAPMFLAAENGIFRDLNLAVAIDGAAGSGEAVTRVASGTHDFGLADLSTAIEFATRNPDIAPKAIMTVYDRFPAVVLSLKRKPIKTLQELAGARVAVGSADAGSKLLPALLALNKVDIGAIKRVTVDVKLRESMLLRGDVEAVIGFDYTSVFNLVEAGIKLDDINLLYYSEHGFDFWGNSLIASRAMIEKNPDLTRRVAAAVARAWVAGAKDRDGAIAAVVRRDGLLKASVERARLDWLYDKLILTDNVRKGGLGQMNAERMERNIKVLVDGFALAKAPSMDQVYDGSFLPPLADRQIG